MDFGRCRLPNAHGYTRDPECLTPFLDDHRGSDDNYPLSYALTIDKLAERKKG